MKLQFLQEAIYKNQDQTHHSMKACTLAINKNVNPKNSVGEPD